MKIIKDDNIDMLINFLIENPGFDLHYSLKSGKRLRLLGQSIDSNSIRCASFLMNKMDFNELIYIYKSFIFDCYSRNEIFNLFLNLCKKNINETGNLELVKSIIYSFLDRSTTIPENIFKDFIKTYSEHTKNILTNDLLFKNNFENLIIQKKFALSVILIELYKELDIDLKELYAKYIICADSKIKKLMKYFKDIDLNEKVYLKEIKSNYYMDFENVENVENIDYNDLVSNEKYSISFLYVLKGFFDPKKHKDLDLFKNNNFEIEFFNLLNEKNFQSHNFFSNCHDDCYESCLFYGFLHNNETIYLKKTFNTDRWNCFADFFGNYKRFNEGNENVINKFKLISKYFTPSMFEKILELNEETFNIYMTYIQNENKYRYFDENIKYTNHSYNLNKNIIEQLKSYNVN